MLPYILSVDDSAVRYLSGPSVVDYRGVSMSSFDEMVSENKSFAYLSDRSITNVETEATEILVL